MLSIQTNVNSLVAQQNLSVNSTFQSKTIQQLTSGYRINSSGDDAAGLAVANKFRSDIAELTQGVANGNDAVASLQIMDGGMSNISQILDRLKTLATQSASGTFTGNRTILNNEFQTEVAEIDRQAQSIGLNVGGLFAKSLDVYLGTGGGSSSLANGIVTLNLTHGTVDSQSLGLTGMQAVAGSADLSSGSDTSVANVLADASNQAAIVAAGGKTTFQFSGPGFSMGSISVQVNVSGIADINSLVTQLNAAIQSAGSAGSSQAAAFKAAGIVASVHTDANGGQQIAFTSSTTAFQVQAGDQMANALMGNFSSGATGVALASTVTGQDVVASASTVALTGDLYVQISGGGLASAQTITLDQATYTHVDDAINGLKTQINTGTGSGGAGAAIQAAGISVDWVGNQLVFSSSNNVPFQVQAAADKSNWLGLGASLASAGAVQYTTITAAATYASTGLTASAKDSQVTLEFSVEGGAAIALAPIALDGGDAAASTRTGTVDLTNGVGFSTSGTLQNNLLTFTVDGTQAVTVTFAGNTTPHAKITGTANLSAGHNFTAGDADLLIGYDGGALKTVTLTNNDASLDDVVTDLQAAINTAFTWNSSTQKILVGTSGNFITLTDVSANTGTASTLEVQQSGAEVTLTTLGIAIGGAGTGGSVSGDATTAESIKTQIQAAADAQLTGGLGVTVTLDGSNQVVITNANAGADHTISNLTGNAATDVIGGTGTAVLGTNRTLANLETAMNTLIQANATLNAAQIQATDDGGGHLRFVSGNSTNFQVNVGAGLAAGTALGALDITNGVDFSQSPSTLNLSLDGTPLQAIVLDQNYASGTALVTAINAAFTAQSAAATASLFSVNGQEYLQIASNATGPDSSLAVRAGSANTALGLTVATNSGADEANIGFGAASGYSFTGLRGIAEASSTLNLVNANGAAETGALSFTALASGGGTQTLTFSANDSSGVLRSATITLAATGSGTASLGNDGTAASLSAAVNYINQQLQATNNPTLQSIVAVEENVNGTPGINFLSSLRSFAVAVATSTTAGEGVNGGVAESVSGAVSGTGSTIAIDSQAGAQAAVTALATAVGKLGAAQAEVGKGQNQLGYAISLAQSQITNFSAAESYIRDANVAQQAANLTKASVLQQASIAAMAQANTAPQAVLALLRS